MKAIRIFLVIVIVFVGFTGCETPPLKRIDTKNVAPSAPCSLEKQETYCRPGTINRSTRTRISEHWKKNNDGTISYWKTLEKVPTNVEIITTCVFSVLLCFFLFMCIDLDSIQVPGGGYYDDENKWIDFNGNNSDSILPIMIIVISILFLVFVHTNGFMLIQYSTIGVILISLLIWIGLSADGQGDTRIMSVSVRNKLVFLGIILIIGSAIAEYITLL